MGKTNWVSRCLKFRCCLSEAGNGKDLSHWVESGGCGHSPPCGAAIWGGRRAGTCSLPLSDRDLGVWKLLWGKGGQWKQMVAVTMPQPAYRNSLYSCPYLLSIKSIPCSPVWLSRPSDMCLPQCKPSPNLPSCGRRNCCLFSTCVFRGQGSVLCTLQRGAAQIRIRNDLRLTCVFCLCMARVTASNFGKSSVQLSELKPATAASVWLSSHSFKICGQVVPRQAGIFYGWSLLCLAREVAQQTCQLLPRTQDQ